MEQIQPIMVVEDELLIRMSLVDVLEGGGFTVHECANGDAAMADFGSREVLHGLVTDVNLGSDRNGWEVARQGRVKFPSLAVVYITGDSFDDWSHEGVPNSLVLQKPFAEAQLLHAIASVLREAGPQPSV